VRMHAENYGVYGPRKVWLALNREGIEVARCTVERLMKALGLQGIRRGKKCKTTIADPGLDRPADLVQRRFNPTRPNALWVADFTYVATWVGVVYVAFVIDRYARRILGWRAATSMRTQLVLDTLEQAVWVRRREGANLAGLVHHTDPGAHSAHLPRSLRPDGHQAVHGTSRVGLGQRGDRGVAFHADLRAARPRALRHQGPGSRPGGRLDRRVQPRPAALSLRYALSGRLRTTRAQHRRAQRDGRGMTATIRQSMAPSSPASTPRPTGGLRPALTPAAGGTGQHRSGRVRKVHQQTKIRITKVSTESGD